MPPKNYPGTPITLRAKAPNPARVSLPDVVSAFDKIPLAGEYAPLASLKLLRDSKTYNPYSAEDFDRDSNRKRHFQGVVRTIDGKYVIISGGDHKNKAAQLFISEINIQGTNRRKEIGVIPELPKPVGKLKEIYYINDKRFWHGGGISSFGTVLILPLESDGYLPKQKFATRESRIKFLDISNPLKPRDLQIDISRAGTNAGAASLVRLFSGYYLCGVWTDSDPDKGRVLDFYISRTTNLKDGFSKQVIRYFHSKAHKGMNPRYQGIKLVLQDNSDLFMIGTENSWALSPIPKNFGKNRARLYGIKYDVNHTSSKNFKSFSPSLEVIRGTSDKIFNKGRNRYNFNGGAGIYLTPTKSLALYATHHRTYAQGKIISCTEFYPSFEKRDISQERDCLIELYENDNFTGKCLKIRGYNNTTFSNYEQLSVEADHFNDTVNSIKFQIPAGRVYSLFEHKDFQGAEIKLFGTGKLVPINKINYRSKKEKSGVYQIPSNMGGEISSSRYTT